MLGYDLEQQCCECAGWYIRPARARDCDNKNTVPEDDLAAYVFDPDFLEREEICDDEGSSCTSNGIARFRLVALDKPDLFLHLFNDQNGYYSHGFTFHHPEKPVLDGDL
jgi:hypothetical protein